MTVCPYFLQGNCRYGDKCWNEHPTGGRQGNFGGRTFGSQSGRTVAFKDSFSSQNRFAALGQQQTTKPTNLAVGNIKDFTPTQIIDMMSQEMGVWEQSKMWPFSCYAYAKETSCLPGFEDISPEELRLEAYTAEKAGTFASQRSKISQLINDYKTKRQQLKQPAADIKQKLMQIIASNKGSSQSTQGASGLFSQGAANKTGVSSGSSLFGNSQAGGGGAAASVFGNTSGGGSVFGGGSTFGSGKATGSASVFGGSSNTNAGSVFGGSSSQPSSTSVGLFGSNHSSQGTVFGSSSAGSTLSGNNKTGGLFQGNQTNVSSNIFGGNQAGSQTSASGIFSGSQFNQTSSGQAAGLFQQSSQPAQATSGLFSGKKIEMSTVQGSVAAQLPRQQGPVSFANPANAASATVQPFSQTPSTSSSPQVAIATETSSLYTPLDQLTKEEKEQFEAPVFTIGKIPTRPPPKEMVT